MFYSKSTNGFYSSEIHGSIIPEDSVEITTEEHAALLDAQSSGKIIQSDKYGNPIAVDPPALSANDVIRRQIAALEGLITDRMQREAVCGALNTFPANHPKWPGLTSLQAITEVSSQIEQLRGQLT